MIEVAITILILLFLFFAFKKLLPVFRYKNVINLIDSNRINEAIEILEMIFHKHIEAPAKLAECYLKNALSYVDNNKNEFFNNIKRCHDIDNIIKREDQRESYNTVKSKSYVALASEKFREGKILFSSNHFSESLLYFKELKDNYLTYPKTGNEDSYNVLLNAIDLWIKKSIAQLCLKDNNKLLSEAEYNFHEKDYKKAQDLILKIFSSINDVDVADLSSEFDNLNISIKTLLANIKYETAKNHERGRNYQKAIEKYDYLISFLSKENIKVDFLNELFYRSLIAKIKNNLPINNDYSKIVENNKHLGERNDFLYRYCIVLVKQKNYDEAEKILEKYFNKTEKEEVKKLRKLCKHEKLKNSIQLIEAFNNKCDDLFKNNFPEDKTKEFYLSIDGICSTLPPILEDTANKMREFKPSLFNRLLTAYISKERFDIATKLIMECPLFWENSELLKNLGICCFRQSHLMGLNKENYKTIISGWLTSVFSDKVIISSLESTSWDDDYTFTLAESIGSRQIKIKELPDNINCDIKNETNISIGSIQIELLQQFETLMHDKINDNTLAKEVINFYEEEKKSIQNVIFLIQDDLTLATPYLANTFGINRQIIDKLENNFVKHRDEQSLNAGIPYLGDIRNTKTNNYFDAKTAANLIVQYISIDSHEDLRKIMINENRVLVNKFHDLVISLEDNIYFVLSSKIENDPENTALISIMENCINFISNNNKIKHLYSNYVANYCIINVNNKRMNNLTALNYLKKAYRYSSDNSKICKNLVTLILFNLFDIVNNNTSKHNEIYNILDQIILNQSKSFKINSFEISKAREDLLSQLKKTGADISLFDEDSEYGGLKKVQDLIRNKGINQSILGLNRSSFLLNEEGLKIKKVISYMKKLGNNHKNSIFQSEYNDDLLF